MIYLIKEEDIIFNKINVLYFYASWMPYHKKMLIMIDKIEKKYNNIKFLAIDVDYYKNLCNRFNVFSVPTTIIFFNGNELKRIVGLVLTSAFKKVFADIYNSIGEQV
jgi:thioredoxin 1